ncbi:MAG: hypothetical protein MUE33_11165 [Cytophagaceae bacterium]|jgi:hypothetical protein|nr:hypothetical protein [Cytophagaceae bacterium]
MRLPIVLCLLFWTPLALWAQNTTREIKIHEGKETVDRILREGVYVIIELDYTFVKNAWEKKVKEFGRVDLTKGYAVMKNVTIPNVTTGGNSYSNVSPQTNGTKVFWAVEDVSGPVVPGSGHKWDELKKKLLAFAKQTYVDDINNQIIAAENALQAATRNQEKIIREGENLQKQQYDNEQERIELENKLKANAAAKEQLQLSTENNQLQKQNAEAEVQKMQKAVEIVKQRLLQY